MPHIEPGAAAAVPLKRKIAAILAADVAGYSRLVAADEEGTLRALASARAAFDRRVAAAGGRIFNTAGDSVMCEFDSAVEAVRAAIAIQEAIAELARDAPPARRLLFRMGLTIGDVVERGDDLLGDGVNIASRLESLAEPGGICLSRSVHEAVVNKVAAAMTDLGERRVKNIPGTIRAFAIAPAAIPAAVPAAVAPVAAGGLVAERRRSGAAAASPRRRTGRLALAAAALAAAAGLGWTAWRPSDRGETAPPTLAAAAPPAAPNGAPQSSAPDASPPRTPPSRTVRSEPDRPARPAPASLREGYDAARAEEQKGDRQGALRAYAALAPLLQDQVDPVLRYAALLRARSSADATRKTLEEIARTGPSRAAALAAAAQGDGAAARIEAFLTANPDFPPAYSLLAEAYLARPGGPTLTERRLAFNAFDEFLAAETQLPAFFVDRQVLDGWIETARRRQGEIESFFAGAVARPRIRFVPEDGGGWSARLALPEPATRAAIRIGEGGERLAAAAGPAATTADIAIPAGTARSTLYVTYKDASGRDAGPFPVAFDPAGARAAAARETLERFPETWVTFRADLPDLASYAQLANQSCGIAKALIGFGDSAPAQPLPLPACESGGRAASSEPRPVVTLPAGTDSLQVQIAYADGSESRVRTFRRP